MDMQTEQLARHLQDNRSWRFGLEEKKHLAPPLEHFPPLPKIRRDNPYREMADDYIAWWYDVNGDWMGWTTKSQMEYYRKKVRAIKNGHHISALAMRRSGATMFGRAIGEYHFAATMIADLLHVRAYEFLGGDEFLRLCIEKIDKEQPRWSMSDLHTWAINNAHKFPTAVLPIIQAVNDQDIAAPDGAARARNILVAALLNKP